MINYERIKAGIAVIKEFRKELTALCEKYQAKFNEVCPEDIAEKISDVANNHIWIQLSNYSGEYSKNEIVSDGFEFDHEDDGTSFYHREIDGIKVICSIYEEDGTE